MPNDAGGVYQGNKATCKTIQDDCVSSNTLFCLGYVQCTLGAANCDGYSPGEACLYTGNSGNFKICQGFCAVHEGCHSDADCGDGCNTGTCNTGTGVCTNVPKVRGGGEVQVQGCQSGGWGGGPGFGLQRLGGH